MKLTLEHVDGDLSLAIGEIANSIRAAAAMQACHPFSLLGGVILEIVAAGEGRDAIDYLDGSPELRGILVDACDRMFEFMPKPKDTDTAPTGANP